MAFNRKPEKQILQRHRFVEFNQNSISKLISLRPGIARWHVPAECWGWWEGGEGELSTRGTSGDQRLWQPDPSQGRPSWGRIKKLIEIPGPQRHLKKINQVHYVQNYLWLKLLKETLSELAALCHGQRLSLTLETAWQLLLKLQRGKKGPLEKR